MAIHEMAFIDFFRFERGDERLRALAKKEEPFLASFGMKMWKRDSCFWRCAADGKSLEKRAAHPDYALTQTLSRKLRDFSIE